MTVELTEPQQALISALLGDEFEQGRNALRYQQAGGDRFCCLGVGCEVYRRMTGLGRWDTAIYGSIPFIDSAGRTNSTTMPTEVAEFFGLPDGNPEIYMGKRAVTLNDGNLWNFRQIAEAFRETFLRINAEKLTKDTN